jgi:hypothetical protein
MNENLTITNELVEDVPLFGNSPTEVKNGGT